MPMNYDRIAAIALFTPMTGAGYCPPILWTGLPGRAKTAKAAKWAKDHNLKFLHLSPGMKGEGYFGVVPVPTTLPDGRLVLTFPANKDIQEMCDLGRGVILLDELRTAPSVIRPALLGTLQERYFGDLRLPPGVRIMAASNGVKDALNGRPLSPPEANRLCHIKWHGFEASDMREYHVSSSDEHPFADRAEPDYADWSEFEKREQAILAARTPARRMAATQVWTFVQRRPHVDKDGKHVGDSIHMMPPPGSEACDGPWPSERTWTGAMEVLWSYRVQKSLGILKDCPEQESDDPDLQALIRGFVGPVGGELLQWIAEQDLPDYNDWLTDRIKVKFERGRDDRAYLIFSGAGSYILSLPRETKEQRDLRKARVAAFFDRCLALTDQIGFESVMAGVKLIQDEAMKTGVRDDLMVKSAHDFLVKYRQETADIAAGKK